MLASSWTHPEVGQKGKREGWGLKPQMWKGSQTGEDGSDSITPSIVMNACYIQSKWEVICNSKRSMHPNAINEKWILKCRILLQCQYILECNIAVETNIL